MIKISKTNSDFEREPFLTPFGFKGKFVSEVWQTAVLMESERGRRAIGLASEGTLWSDARVFSENPESTSYAMMHLMSAFALRRARETGFDHPMELLDRLLPETFEYGRQVAGRRDMRLTFALNALVPVDNAAWQLYCLEKGISDFDAMIPGDISPALAHRHSELACIPLISYAVPPDGIAATVEDGYFFLKIKIGSDPEKDGDQEKMLAWDMKRLEEIHDIVRDRSIPYTADGRIPYYLDANGRYDSRDRLMRLLEHADGIGALERIMILEEPFPEEYREDVSDIPVRLAADESAHSDREARERIDLGYRAIALKPIAKTMSMSLRIAKLAHERGVPCFCADLTVNPILVDWNKNVAARLAPLPGMKIGVIESNGHQNYRNWEKMKSYHPRHGARWMESDGGLFRLDEDFYACSGGILEPPRHYLDLLG